jgi:hypothetical protein
VSGCSARFTMTGSVPRSARGARHRSRHRSDRSGSGRRRPHHLRRADRRRPRAALAGSIRRGHRRTGEPWRRRRGAGVHRDPAARHPGCQLRCRRSTRHVCWRRRAIHARLARTSRSR